MSEPADQLGTLGPHDERGTLNLITAEVRARAVAEARSGRTVHQVVDGKVYPGIPHEETGGPAGYRHGSRVPARRGSGRHATSGTTIRAPSEPR